MSLGAAARRFLGRRRGASAVETALVLPGALFLVLLGFSLVVATYAYTCLLSATQAGARYASVLTAVNSGAAPDELTISTYATQIYKGPASSVSFCCVNPGGQCIGPGAKCASVTCGHQVKGTGVYHLFYGGRFEVTMNADACYP